jgi:FkbM family methyltransferase
MIALEGQYETNELALIKNTFAHFLQDKTILDVGANIGNHTVAFSKIAKNVIAFEPNPLVFELLKINTKNLKNVRIFNFGASDKDAEYEAEVPPSNCGGGHILINSEDRESNSLDSKFIFQLRKIDDLEEIVSRDIGLVKVDVEGHEINVFRGMRNLLFKQKPPVLFEQIKGINNGTSQEIEFLRSIGYEYLYEIDQAQKWLTPDFLPHFTRSPLKILEVAIIGEPSSELTFRKIESLNKSAYNLLLMTSQSL